MIPHLPVYILVSFIVATLLTVFLFYRATKNSDITFIILCTWIMLQAILSLKGFYTVTDTAPPHLILAIAPPVLLILILFITKQGKQYIDSLNDRSLTYLHSVRILVEIGLFALLHHKLIPQSMTFEGRNFDIFSGLTAPLVAYAGYEKKWISNKVMLTWNFICLALVLNVVVTGILSAPSVFQQLAFDQPNIAILYFPFVWLPCCIVPLVIFSHLVCIRQLLKNKKPAI